MNFFGVEASCLISILMDAGDQCNETNGVGGDSTGTGTIAGARVSADGVGSGGLERGGWSEVLGGGRGGVV